MSTYGRLKCSICMWLGPCLSVRLWEVSVIVIFVYKNLFHFLGRIWCLICQILAWRFLIRSFLYEGLDGGGGGGGYKCQLSVKISAICQLSVKFLAICQLSVTWLLIIKYGS